MMADGLIPPEFQSDRDPNARWDPDAPPATDDIQTGGGSFESAFDDMLFPPTPGTTEFSAWLLSDAYAEWKARHPADAESLEQRHREEIQSQQAEVDPYKAADPITRAYMDRDPITGESPAAAGTPIYGPGVEPDPVPPGYWGGYRPPPQYVTDDPVRILNGMSTAEIDALERELERANYLDPDRFTPGTGRSAIIPAFTQVIYNADTNRVSWEKQLEGDVNRYQQWLEDNPEEGPAPYPPFVAPAFLKPDYATLAQKTKAQLRSELRRDPTSGEMKLLTGFLDEGYHRQWKANEYDVAYANWEANKRAYETGENQSAGTVQGVDAQAEFNEYFDERFADELTHRERVAESTENTPNLFGSIDTISRMTS